MTYEPRDLADLLQPYVDGELSDEERKHVAHYLESSPEAQSRVRQQQAVRAALRSLEQEIAPAQLRVAVLAGLDEVDADNVVSLEDGPKRSKGRAILRGALLMAPAAAAAVALFFVVRGDLGTFTNAAEQGASLNGAVVETPQRGEAVDPPKADASGTALPPGESLPAMHGTAQAPVPRGYQLVSAGNAGTRYEKKADSARRLVLERATADQAALQGTVHSFRGVRYYLSRDDAGRARVRFTRDGTVHTVFFEHSKATGATGADPEHPDFEDLVDFAEALQAADSRR